MIEEIPFSFKFNYGVVVGPTNHGIENYALVGEWSIWIVTNRVANKMSVTRRVREIIFAIVFVHPGSLEETFIVVFAEKWLAIFIHNGNFFCRSYKPKHIFA